MLSRELVSICSPFKSCSICSPFSLVSEFHFHQIPSIAIKYHILLPILKKEMTSHCYFNINVSDN